MEIESKSAVNHLTRTKELLLTSSQEYEALKKHAEKILTRQSYKLHGGISLKLYTGDYQGLVRAEVEFATEKEAMDFSPPKWFGAEITSSPLGKDGELLKLSTSEFHKLLQEVMTSS